MAMENIEEETATTGKRINFESAVTYLLPKYPVANKWNKSNKRNQYQIYDTSAQVQGFGYTSGTRKTGVKFIYHTNHSYDDIKDDRKKKLGEWRK